MVKIFKENNFVLIFRNTIEPLFGYTDADWGNCPNDSKSYTGCFIFSAVLLFGKAVNKVQYLSFQPRLNIWLYPRGNLSN